MSRYTPCNWQHDDEYPAPCSCGSSYLEGFCVTCNASVCRDHMRKCDDCGAALCGSHAHPVDECHFCRDHVGAAMAQSFEAQEAERALGAAMVAGGLDDYFLLAVDLVRERRAGL